MAEFVGADLNRMAGELEKLILTLPEGARRITPEQIERNIGISKDYNNFELRSALVEKDVLKANKNHQILRGESQEQSATNDTGHSVQLLLEPDAGLLCT